MQRHPGRWVSCCMASSRACRAPLIPLMPPSAFHIRPAYTTATDSHGPKPGPHACCDTYPTCLIQVFFGEDEVTDGVEVSLAALAQEPTISISGVAAGSRALHTLVMVDPDMPSPNNPKYK